MELALSFDDVLIVPQHNTIASRDDVDLQTKICGKTLYLPIFAANMASICEAKMANAMARYPHKLK